ncbi:CarD family transcriptional regulator [Thermophilibacter immobilis]|jgi:CarD family transcriptional regulator|uniref:CarD family transcriptional regulator n=1 Tax=Thermophilibacter immobilis TaxID=2779519 RepID=A0A7S7RUX9_9ACTN|nr:CarD family transcriptional regulator [Thermophilibacter immobilis]QOY61023.1 CarD family transcriptional regulator [Thermophilibacter immobilis]
MYAVGDYIVHPGQGVCQIEGVIKSPEALYQLLPVGQRHPVRISFPVSIEDRLRPVLSHDEAQEIIDDYPAMRLDDFEARNNSLEEEHYKNEIRKGSCRDSVRIVKTFHARIADLSARNKKPPVAYERILKQARERSYVELSVALGCTPDDVVMLFEGSADESASQN